MKFDSIVGNPPYQDMDNSSTKGSAKPLYHYFIQNGIALNPNYLSFITPSVWFTGGKGLDDFRDNMLKEKRIQKIYNFNTPQDVFSNVNLRGGVNYFLWNKDYDNTNGFKMVNVTNGNKQIALNRTYHFEGTDIFIADNFAVNIIQRFIKKGIIKNNNEERAFKDYVSVRNPFGFATDFRKNKEFNITKENMLDPIKIYTNKGQSGYVENRLITKNREWISKWKVITPFANNIGTDLSDDNLNTIISEPNSIVTETYLVIGADLVLNRKQCENIEKYLKTKFVRFLISIVKANQNGTRQTYKYVPMQNFSEDSDINWNSHIQEINFQLYKKYNLTDDEISYIESKIKEME